MVSTHSYARHQIMIHIDFDLGHNTLFGETHLDRGFRQNEGYMSFVAGHVAVTTLPPVPGHLCLDNLLQYPEDELFHCAKFIGKPRPFV